MRDNLEMCQIGCTKWHTQLCAAVSATAVIIKVIVSVVLFVYVYRFMLKINMFD